MLQRHHLLAPHAVLCSDNVLRTAAAEFLWRVANDKAAPGELCWEGAESESVQLVVSFAVGSTSKICK